MSILSDDSVFQQKQHNVPQNSFYTQPFIQKSDNFLNDIVNKYLGQNKSLNVLAKNQNQHNIINPQFQQYLRMTSDDRNLVLISVIGSKGVGKSFLLDLLISQDSGKTSRVMSQNKQPIINTSTYQYNGKKNTKVLFFDANGVTQKQDFLWLYLLSSVIILNLKQQDQDSQQKFVKQFQYVSHKIKVSQPTDLSQPQLIIVRRDCVSEEPKQQQGFLKQIEKTGIFHPDLHHIYLPHPSKIKTARNKIVSLPEMNLNQNYKDGVHSINRLLKSRPPKILKGNFFNSKLLAFSLHPTLDDINNEQQVNIDKLWGDIIENYGIQYKDAYMRQYKLRLNKDFQGQNAKKQYQVYRLLADVKRKTDKNFIGYQNLEGDPIYEKYNKKLQQQIKQQEEQVIRDNHKLVVLQNSENCRQKMSKLTPKNYAQMIDDYNNQCPCQYEKSDVLLDNFKFFIDQKIKAQQSQQKNGKSPQLMALQQQLTLLNTKIQQSKIRLNDDGDKNIEQLESTIKQKQNQLQDLRKSVAVKKSQNPDLLDLQKQNHQLQQQLKREQEQAQRLLRQKHKKIKDARTYLQRQLEDQKMKYTRLQRQLKSGVNIKNAGTKGVDKTCCIIM